MFHTHRIEISEENERPDWWTILITSDKKKYATHDLLGFIIKHLISREIFLFQMLYEKNGNTDYNLEYAILLIFKRGNEMIILAMVKTIKLKYFFRWLPKRGRNLQEH